jgi:hypothetical protein
MRLYSISLLYIGIHDYPVRRILIVYSVTIRIVILENVIVNVIGFLSKMDAADVCAYLWNLYFDYSITTKDNVVHFQD